MPEPVPREQATDRERELGALINSFDPGDYGLRIALEAHARQIPVAVLCAVIEQESGFRNVWGRDEVTWPQYSGGEVTKLDYARYKILRKAGYGMQGCGPGQLTWFAFQDEADESGGCWEPGPNIATTAWRLGELRRERGNWPDAFEVYNAGKVGTPAGAAYSARVQDRQRKWQERLT